MLPSPSWAAPARPRSAPSPAPPSPWRSAITQGWQVVILGAALVAVIGLRRSVVLTLVAAGVAGAVGAVLGLPVGT